MRLLRKTRPPEPGELLQERWSTSFGLFRRDRFAQESTPRHTVSFRRGHLTLELLKPSCFAWSTTPYKYRDFVLEGRLAMDPENGHAAAGFVFRHLDEENFYYFLLSNRGHFRLDLVFNRNPFHLIEWTQSPLLDRWPLSLRVVARGDFFAFFVEDEWVAEARDGTLSDGSFGFAAQNFEERERGRFYLRHVSVDSRPLEVEKQYYRWVHVVPPRPEFRVALGRSFLAAGKPLEAIGQLRKVLAQRPGEAEDFLLLGEACLQGRLHEEAVKSLDRSLALQPGQPAAQMARANAVYLTKDYLAAREYIRSLLPQLSGEPFLHNLLGNCEYALGNWAAAEAAYREAIRLDAEPPLYRENLARSLERLGRSEEALDTYLEAARRLFAAEAHHELSLVISRALDLLPPGEEMRRRELKALEGKMLYQEGDKRAAEVLFRELVDAGVEDSSVEYLYALILIEKGRRPEAQRYLRQAAEREGSRALYWFRLAENRHLLGQDPEEALGRAYALAPEDPWVNNLYGQVLLEGGAVEQALGYFERALAAAPEAVDVYRNHAEVLRRLGRAQEAVELATRGLERCGEQAELYNQRGNSLVELERFAAAREDYERALALDGDNLEYVKNCATCCLELELVLRAEELQNRLLEERPDAWAYNLTGNLAMLKGEHERARLAFEEALKLEPENRDVQLNLVSLFLDQGLYEPARERLKSVLSTEPQSPRGLQLQGRVRERFETRLSCAACGREWWVARELPPQPGFSIRGEPPGEAPAGRCGQCGRVYCVACASAHLRDQRLTCAECGQPLRLTEEALKHLLLRYVSPEGDLPAQGSSG